ncbi:MAG: sigma-54 dependent transcriptional regulator [Betaproteobacteria bacterium]
MSALWTSTSALWLDPFRPLSAANQAQLGEAGLHASPISTLEELEAGLSAPHQGRRAVVLGLGTDIALLHETMTLVNQMDHAVAVVCRTERRQLELAVQALQTGACHVIAADDWSAAAWQAAIQRASIAALPAAALADNGATETTTPTPVSKPATESAVRSVVYVDPVSRNLLALAQRVAQAQVAVLIEGPTGSGKEVLARVLHEASSAANGPFIGLNCAALPEHMIEDMLFGHEKGAFTGAVKEHRGLFEQAQGGTLFLDEIGELPLQLQAKLLRVLQERTLVRLGGERFIALDVRVVAATNKNLRESIGLREFREDLYFRLSTFKLRVPPLAERAGDILPLVARLLARHTRTAQTWSVSAAAQALLLAYAWPGNVRELENVMQRAVVLCADHHIDVQHLMFDDMPDDAMLTASVRSTSVAPGADSLAHVPSVVPTEPVPMPVAHGADAAAAPSGEAHLGGPLQAAVKHNENHLIRMALESSRSRLEAAEKLGISPRTLRYKLARLRDMNLPLLSQP